MTRVFVSHASADSDFAEKFSSDLRAFGVDVWLDSSHMGPGDFVTRINTALQRDVLILILTPAALQSPWVQQEMNAAIARANQKLMSAPIVVLAAPCSPEQIPALWTVYHRYDATRDRMQALASIVRQLDILPSGSGESAALQPPVPVAARAMQGNAEPIVVAVAEAPTSYRHSLQADTLHRHRASYWVVMGGAVLVALLALVFLGPEGPGLFWRGGVPLLAQSALIIIVSLISLAGTRHGMRQVALIVVCEVALGLSALSWKGGTFLLPMTLITDYIFQAVVLLAAVLLLRRATRQQQRHSWVTIYSITVVCLVIFLSVFYGLYAHAWEPLLRVYALSDTTVGIALLATVYALSSAISRRRWGWFTGIVVIAAICFGATMLSSRQFPEAYTDLLWALLPFAAVLYGLFAKEEVLAAGEKV
jgi:hypothetical protein